MPSRCLQGFARQALLLTYLVVSGIGACCEAQHQPAAAHTFTVRGHDFVMDGNPFQIISGEMHYPRVPRAYWRDRFRKAKAMGLNTITTYAFWNVHEPRPGVYDFTGQNDIAEYIREAQGEGLHVILRPGPYVCAEWELGGYPSWLLKDRSVVLRSDEPKYKAAVSKWFVRLAREIKPLLIKNGGPIIAVQIENEYGSFDNDQTYLEGVKQQLIASGMGDVLLYTANPASNLAAGSLPGVPTVINFGTGDAHRSFAKLEQLRPEGPRMTGEFWAGWFDKWGEEHHQTDGVKEAAEFRWMLEQGYSVSLYMFHGGTSFGWMNGADSHTGKDYHPDTTSYDYSAPLNENGEPTYKFDLFRKAIADVTHTSPTPMPAAAPPTAFAVEPQMLSASLWKNLPAPVESPKPLTFEDLDQSFGYVLYQTRLKPGSGGKLSLPGVHDYAQVYLNQRLIGTVDRRLVAYVLEVPIQPQATTLDILVENTGRVNYSKAIRTERAGLTAEVTLAGTALQQWKQFSLPMDDLSRVRFTPVPCSGPCFFRTRMTVSKAADTYFDTRGLHKGQLWVGTHNLGRFWTAAGPEYTLYAPAPWMSADVTDVTFFDLMSDGTERLVTVKEPIFGVSKSTRETQ